MTGDGSPIVICWQTGYDGKESAEVRELSEGEMEEKIRHARKVNGHVENGEST